MGVKTRLGDDGLGARHIDEVIAALQAQGMAAPGERGAVTPAVRRAVPELSL